MPSETVIFASGPVDAVCGRSGSIGQNGGQSPCRPRTGSRRLRYARSTRGLDCAAPCHSAAAVSEGISVIAH
jgi:hypothetical protein